MYRPKYIKIGIGVIIHMRNILCDYSANILEAIQTNAVHNNNI